MQSRYLPVLSALTVLVASSADASGCIDTNPQGNWVTRTLSILQHGRPPIPVVGKLQAWSSQAGELRIDIGGQSQVVRSPVSLELSFQGPSPVAQALPPKMSGPTKLGPISIEASKVRVENGLLLLGADSSAADCHPTQGSETAFAGTIEFGSDNQVNVLGDVTEYSPPNIQLGPEDVVKRKGG